jgi:peptidoglycan glycosyltransferase
VENELDVRIRRMYLLISILFVLMLCWQAQWHLWRAGFLADLPTNRRAMRTEQSIPRGTIYDCSGQKLAWTVGRVRKYADPFSLSGIIGYVNPKYGRAGVEKALNSELAGIIKSFDSAEITRILNGDKRSGKDITLTIDLKLQNAAYAALDNRRGAVAVIEPASGRVLALATSPTFNINDPSKKGDDGSMTNRAIAGLYPPGSTMKVLTAATALQDDPTSAGTTYTCEGNTTYDKIKITDYHGERHGTIAMQQALTHSCNYYFARTAINLGFDKLESSVEKFGFNRDWMSDFPLAVKKSRLINENRFIPEGELAQIGFGQGTVTVTPLQMAMVAATVANDGVLMRPYLIDKIQKLGKPAQIFAPETLDNPMDIDNAQKLAEMMRNVVTSGTGTRANLRNVRISGKTGTAQQVGGDDHAWFIGFAEKEVNGTTSKIAFAVVLERGGTGGKIAAPVAAKVAEAWSE